MSRSSFLKLLQVHWALLVHFVLTVATAMFVASYVNRRHFSTTFHSKADVIEPDGTISAHGFMMRQTDLTTLVSAAQTLLRILGGIWTGATVWRCMFLLMKTGITLSNFQSTISWRFPTWCLYPPLYKHFNANSKLGTLLFVTLTIILTFPSQLSSPILTGSINWVPSNFTVHGTKQVKDISNTGPGTDAWYWYRRAPQVMAPIIVDLAGATAVDIWGRNLPARPGRVMRRYLYTASNLTVGSQLDTVTVPFFSIESFRWLNSTEIVPIQFRSKTLGTYELDPLITSERPWVALIPPIAWEPSQDPAFPQAHIKDESRILVVLVDPAPRMARLDLERCRSLRSTFYFGKLPSDIGVKARSDGHCFAFAAVSYRAGAADCRNCRIFTTGVVESGDVSALTLKKDPVTSDALVLLPKASQSMISGNSSVPLPYAPWPLESNITHYVTEVLSRTYQSIWNALTEELHADNASLSTNVRIVVSSSVQAQVAIWRVWLWLGLNVMLTFSGLFWFLYIRSDLGIVFDAESTALLMDPTFIDRYDDRRLSMFEGSVSNISRDVGYLRLKKGVPSSLRQRAPEMSQMDERWFLESVEHKSRHTSTSSPTSIKLMTVAGRRGGVGYERIDTQSEETGESW